MTHKHPRLLDADRACLIVVDVQERFRNAMSDFDQMAAGCIRLVRTFRALELPIVVTEQYPKGLGHTVPELSDALGEASHAYTKTCFSSCGSEEVSTKLVELRVSQALVCGIETHVCVSQTVHDLLQRGVLVHVAADAVGSRKQLDRDYGLRKMERSGAVLTTTETAAFELLEDAKHPRFKEVQAFYK